MNCYVPSYSGMRSGYTVTAAEWQELLRRITAVTRAKAKRKTRSDKGTKRPHRGPMRAPDSGVVLF